MEKLFNIYFLFVILSCKQNNLSSTNESKNSSVPKVEIIDKNDPLAKAVKTYNKIIVLQAIFSIEGNTFNSFIYDKKSINIIEVIATVEKNKDSLNYILAEYSKYLISLGRENQTKKTEKIYNWCSFHFMFRTLNNLNYGKPIFFEQLLYEMPSTRKLFDRYINTNIGQDWGSLDVNQNILLFFDFYKYLTDLPAKEQIEIIDDYIRRIEAS